MTQTSEQHKETLLSQTIDFLRFPLIVIVLFMHNPHLTVYVGDDTISGDKTYPVFEFVCTWLVNIIGPVAVPLFFFMSGFLFFYKVETFDSPAYLRKLGRRVRTLLVPYIFWNLAAVAVYWLCIHLPFISGFFNPGRQIDLRYTLEALVWHRNDYGIIPQPLVYPLWFVRDLFVCVVISPILFFIATRLRWYGVALLGLVFVLGLRIPVIGPWGFDMKALFFFTFGGWFSLHRKNPVYIARDLKALAWCYPPVLLIDYFVRDTVWFGYINRVGILLGIVACFVVVSYMLERGRLRPVPLLASASFFLYVIHDPILMPQIRKLAFKIIRPDSDLEFTLIYFGVVIVTAAVAVGLYMLLRRVAPRLLLLATGTR